MLAATKSLYRSSSWWIQLWYHTV